MQHFLRSGAIATLPQQIDKIKKYPIFTGILLELYWGTVEPYRDTLNLARIEAALKECRDVGIDLRIWWQDKQFNPDAGACVPEGFPTIKIGSKNNVDVLAANLEVPAVREAYDHTVRRLDCLYPEVKYFDVAESAPGVELKKVWDEAAWTRALEDRYVMLGQLGIRAGANLNYHPNLETLLTTAWEEGLYFSSGDAQDTDGTKLRAKTFPRMEHHSAVTLESQKTHGTLQKQWNWLVKNSVSVVMWTDFLKSPFSIAEIAKFVKAREQ